MPPDGLRNWKKELRGEVRPGEEGPWSPEGPRYMFPTTWAAAEVFHSEAPGAAIDLRRAAMSMLILVELLLCRGMEGAVSMFSVMERSRLGPEVGA